MTLYIINNSEDSGIRIEAIAPDEFDSWIKEHTDDIREDCHPRFVAELPDERSPRNEYLVINGKVIVPKPIKIVKSYTLDD